MWPTSLGRHLSDLIHQHRQPVKRKGWLMEPIASGDHHVAATRAFEAAGLQTQTAQAGDRWGDGLVIAFAGGYS